MRGPWFRIVSIARRQERADEHVQLPVYGPRTVGRRYDVRVVKAPVLRALDEARPDGDRVLAREVAQLLGGRTVRHRLGERCERIA